MKILNTKETADAILELIKTSKIRCFIISPYIDFKRRYTTAILENKDCEFVMIYGKNVLKYEAESFALNSKNIHLAYCDNLHAKIYLNEKDCIISSMNLYKFSENNNHEISVKFKTNSNEGEKVFAIIDEILNNSELEKRAQKKRFKKIGYCIRTGIEINFNDKRPFSYESWKEWDKQGANEDFPEKFCHLSGKESFGKTSFANPILKY
jgi:hypothetical protein